MILDESGASFSAKKGSEFANGTAHRGCGEMTANLHSLSLSCVALPLPKHLPMAQNCAPFTAIVFVRYQ